MLEHFLVPQLNVNSVTWQQDNKMLVPLHYHRDVKQYLNQTFQGRWIDCDCYSLWPPKSPDLTPIDVSFWGFMKDNAYMPPMPVDLQELCNGTVNTIALVGICHFLEQTVEGIGISSVPWS
jgi:hypothetical protein